MVEYREYAALAGSADSDRRAQAARIAARAFVQHDGPEEERAALYAAVLGHIDDASVRVRAALAYELLRDPLAPRPVMIALAHDETIIATAVAQYSPVLLDADLIALVALDDPALRQAVAKRESLSSGVVATLVAAKDRDVDLTLLQREGQGLGTSLLAELAARHADDPMFRGLLVCRKDLPAELRVRLTGEVIEVLGNLRIVRGAVRPDRLRRLLRDAADDAATAPYESEAGSPQTVAGSLTQDGQMSIRLLLHAMVHGRSGFVRTALAHLSGTGPDRVAQVVSRGSRAALDALLARSGLPESHRLLLSRMFLLSRGEDLANDVSARHRFVATILSDIVEAYEGHVPAEMQAAFAYLNEQNVAVARAAARGALAAFMDTAPANAKIQVDGLRDHDRLALPAA